MKYKVLMAIGLGISIIAALACSKQTVAKPITSKKEEKVEPKPDAAPIPPRVRRQAVPKSAPGQLHCYEAQMLLGEAPRRVAFHMGVCAEQRAMCEESRNALGKAWAGMSEHAQVSECAQMLREA